MALVMAHTVLLPYVICFLTLTMFAWKNLLAAMLKHLALHTKSGKRVPRCFLSCESYRETRTWKPRKPRIHANSIS